MRILVIDPNTTEAMTRDIECDPDAAEREIIAEATLAVASDGAEAICLGCAGMGPLDRRVQEALGVPVIDGVAAATKLLEGLLGYGLATSRVAAFMAPEAKELASDSDVLRAFRTPSRAAKSLRI